VAVKSTRAGAANLVAMRYSSGKAEVRFMKRQMEFAVAASMRVMLAVFAMLALGICAFAQIGASSAPSQSPRVNQLPLSGREAQNGSVAATETPVPGTTTSVNTLNPTVQVQGPYAGSADSTAKMPFTGKLSLREAVQRGLAYNLSAVGFAQAMRQAHGQASVARSSLLPNITANASETFQTINLQAMGIRLNAPIPGFAFPAVVGPFNYMDLRAKLTQTVANFTVLNNYRAAKESLHAEELSAQDARQLVVLAVGGVYLQVIAAQARVDSAQARVDTAKALLEQTQQQFQSGTVPQIDVTRGQVELLTQQQRLTSLRNDLSKQKLNLARLTGLPVTEQIDLTDTLPYSPAPAFTVEQALKQAVQYRADLKAAETQVRAAQRALAAARDERLPSLTVNADYGTIGANPGQAHGTYTITGNLSVPIWQGGRIRGDIEQAEAALGQRRAELEDTKGQIERQVREAFLDLQAAASQIEVSQKNLELTRQTLEQTRLRLDTGVVNYVDVVQSQESISSAELDYINSVFAHNLAKLSLARAIGQTESSLPQFLNLQ
jgi:outer membrane protein TolC